MQNMSDAELLQKHPLFSRLSGQIVWYMFEERGVPPERIDQFMQSFESLKKETANTIRRVLDADDKGARYVLLELSRNENAGPPCEACVELEGAIISTSDMHVMNYVPPFSLGCRLQATLLSEGQVASLPSTKILDKSAGLPPRKLYCDNEWIFNNCS